MPDIDYGKILGDLKDAVIGTVKESAGKFLDENKDARDFLEDQAKDLAELGIDYVKASSDEARAKVAHEMKIVQQSIRNKLSGIAVAAEAESRATFGKILETAMGVLVKALPVIVAAL
jgi:hypothetical protein